VKKSDLQSLSRLYREELLNNVIPFWMKYSPDKEYGGFFHCFDRDGTVVNTDKNMWPQNRQVWTFSMLYNSLEKRGEWLEIAKLGIDFLKKYGRDNEGDWYFCLQRDGSPLIQPYNIFSDCFAVIGFAEYARASGDNESLDIAISTYKRIQQRKDNPKGKYSKTVPGARKMKTLAIPMINVNTSRIMNEISPDPVYNEIIDREISDVMNSFLDQETLVMNENIPVDGGSSLDDVYEGRMVNPGHGIEAMWFIMEIANQRGDSKLVKQTCDVILRALEFGWDKEYGGIYYFMDKHHKPHIELQWDMKLWWPHLEALIATIMGYRLTGNKELLSWFHKIHDYTWSRFPDKEYGEWFGYLSRQGEVNNNCKANRWKVCFHLPRALYMVSEITAALASTT